MSLFLCIVWGSVLTSSFTCCSLTFPTSLAKETVFLPLYTFASFVKDELTIDVWVYFWTLYSVALIYMSVFMSIPCCFNYCSFVVFLNSGRVMPPALFFFLKIDFAILGLLWLCINFRIFVLVLGKISWVIC